MQIVSPAGNVEKLYYAWAYGADAAYIGLKSFSLRVKADNFHDDEYKQVIDLKNKFPGKKLYCALNISFHNYDLDAFVREIPYFKQYPIDSFIISDLGVIDLVKKHFPNAQLHLSTQANCINREAVKVYKRLGFSRVVLGREASLKDIREIKDACPEMELEVFAHGAMCIAYSGRCLLSAYMTGRSANEGFCSHSCRWDYNVLAEKPVHESAIEEKPAHKLPHGLEHGLVLEEKERPGEYFPVFEGDDYTAILSSKDICMIDHLDDMKKAGVDAIKIEGRMKSLYYVALVTRSYRKALDALEGKISQKDAEPYIAELYKTNHREFATGFFYSPDDANKTTRGETKSDWVLAGTIGRALDEAETAAVFETARRGTEDFEKEFAALHPDAQKARLKDYEQHPEKKYTAVEKKDGYKFYVFNPLNKLFATDTIEYIGPDVLFIPDSDFFFVNAEDASLEPWVTFHNNVLIYTNKPVGEGDIVRTRRDGGHRE